jgi:hypothetical protein
MSWIQNRAIKARQVRLCAAAIGLAASAYAAQAATIVVRSNGPSAAAFPPGKSLADGAAIMLKAGDVITVLDATGTRVLRGPGRVPVSGAGQANVNGIAALIADTGARQTRTGATRGSNLAPPHPTNVWYVDLTRGGNFCIGNIKALALWRANSDLAASVTMVGVGKGDGGARAQIAFRPGQAVVAWPLAALPVSEGSKFRIEGAVPVTIVTRVLPSSPAALDDVAKALLDHGCTAQVDTLVAATTVDPGS